MTENTKDLVDWDAVYAERQKARRAQVQFSGNRIRLNNGIFKTPDDAEGPQLSVVVLDFVSVNLFFDRAYNPDNPIPPACFSISTNPTNMEPSTNSPAKQHDNCDGCPMNEFGSALVGRGKACKNTRLLAVLPANDPTAPIWLLSIPPTSIKFWDKYVLRVGQQQKDIAQVVTVITQDPKQTYTAPRFEMGDALNRDEMTQFGPRFDEAHEVLTQEPNVEEYEPPPQAKGSRGK